MLRFLISEIVEQKQHYISDSPKAPNENNMIQEAISQSKRANHPKTRSLFRELRLCNQDLSFSDRDMHFYKKVFKSKNPIHGRGPATSTSSSVIGTIDLVPSISASGATEEVIHQASVGLQEINDLPPVSFLAAGVNLIHNLLIHPID